MIQFRLEISDNAERHIRHLATAESYREGSGCFICTRGFTAVGPTAETDEHIVPGWIQREFRCKDSVLLASNGTTMKLSRFRLPMCKECNNENYSKTETAVKKYFLEEGVVNGYHISLWLLKLLFGARYKEGNLTDFIKRDGSRVYDLGAVKTQMLLMRLFLNAMYRPLAVGSSLAISPSRLPISVFPIEITDSTTTAFDFHVGGNVLELSLGNRALISVLDGGLTQAYFSKLARPTSAVRMDRNQFAGLCAYLAALIDGVEASPYYFLQADNFGRLDITLHSLSPFGPGSYRKIFLPRNIEHRVHGDATRGLVPSMKVNDLDKLAFYLYRFLAKKHVPNARWSDFSPETSKAMEELIEAIHRLPEP